MHNFGETCDVLRVWLHLLNLLELTAEKLLLMHVLIVLTLNIFI